MVLKTKGQREREAKIKIPENKFQKSFWNNK